MKKGKLLTIVTGLLAVAALTGCNETSYKEGVAITFTQADGTKVEYKASDLFEDYQNSSSTATTDFSKVKEILIRQYYADPSRATDFDALKKDATKDVEGIKDQAKTNANNNGTTYAAELETLFKGEGVENVEELFQKKLYEAELKKFEQDFKAGDNLTYIRDGVREDGKPFFPESTNFGPGSKGYLGTRLPYNVSHILLEASGASESDATSTAISETEASRFGDVILMMAGAKTEDSKRGEESVSSRLSFGVLAKTYSKDTGSAEKYGSLGIMDVTTSFVQGFQYGVYAYDTIYRKAGDTFHEAEKKGLQWAVDATYRDGSTEKLLSSAATGSGVLSSIGTIPFGAAVALANDQVNKNFPNQNFKVNDGNSAYMPRNVIWNKYFNSHRIAVIIPTKIAYNEVVSADFSPVTEATVQSQYYDTVNKSYKKTAEENAWKGTKDSSYAALPGFSVDTSDYLDLKDANGAAVNALTNEKGQIILAVRGDSGTKGIHFITIDRSPLSQYGDHVKAGKLAPITSAEYEATKDSADVTTLSEFYTLENPEQSKNYPTYTFGGAKVNKTTNIAMGIDTTKANYSDNIDSFKSTLNNFNSDIMETYEVQYLLEKTGAEFNTANPSVKKVFENVKRFSAEKRTKNAEDAQESLDNNWAKYAEFRTAEDEARKLRDKGDQKLISELAAITYNTNDAQAKTGVWGVGQPCYEKA